MRKAVLPRDKNPLQFVTVLATVGARLGVSSLDVIKANQTDADGAGLYYSPIVGFVLAVDLDSTDNYIVYAFFKKNADKGYANRVVLASKGLSLGVSNDQGTSVVNGGTNVQQFMIGFVD